MSLCLLYGFSLDSGSSHFKPTRAIIAQTAGEQFSATSSLSKSNHFIEFFKQLNTKSSLLDVGPGRGVESSIAINLNLNVTGLDISKDMVAFFVPVLFFI